MKRTDTGRIYLALSCAIIPSQCLEDLMTSKISYVDQLGQLCPFLNTMGNLMINVLGQQKRQLSGNV
jgi:hypothetical protein